MSEYQYFEFQAIDRVLTADEQARLRTLSSRAEITAASFINHYQWGDFRGNPRQLVEDCFDLHLYLANWGTRRLIIRVPEHVLDKAETAAFLDEIDWVDVWTSGGNLIVDIDRNEVDAGSGWVDGSGWLAALAPLRTDLLAGDLRLFYLLWLTNIETDVLADETKEPLPGIGPLNDALDAAVDFFGIDRDLVEAAATTPHAEPSQDMIRTFVAGIPDEEKTDLLIRLIEGDSHIGPDLLRQARRQGCDDERARRTVGELRRMAQDTSDGRQRAAAEKRRAEAAENARAEANARRLRVEALRHRGEDIWHDIESEIELRNAAAYDRVVTLLADLKHLAADQGTTTDFSLRLEAIRARHARKRQFIKRLHGL